MNITYEPKEPFIPQEKCGCPVTDEAMSFVDRSMATYKALMETNDILDSIATLLSGSAHSEPVGAMPECLDANIQANMFWASAVRDRVKSLALLLGVKDF